MSGPSITHRRIPECEIGKILDAMPRPNFGALFVVSVVAFIWFELSPICLPAILRLISFLAPVCWFLCEVVVALAALLLSIFGPALLGLLPGGNDPEFALVLSQAAPHDSWRLHGNCTDRECWQNGDILVRSPF
jgi:hypothetical protein